MVGSRHQGGKKAQTLEENHSLPVSPSENARFLGFLLDRLNHDLSNTIGGVFSLADHHLRAGLADSQALSESLNLIYRSCDESRRLLLLVGELLDPHSSGVELVRVTDLAAEITNALRVLLPRSVQLKQSLSGPEGAIQVSRMRLVRSFVALMSQTLPPDRSRIGEVRLDVFVKAETALFTYESEAPASPDLSREAQALFADSAPSIEMAFPGTGKKFIFSLRFPLHPI
jgi:hypothetical protein